MSAPMSPQASPLLSNQRFSQQHGMALLTVLLLVVAITIIAGSMLARQRLLLREYALTQDQTQLREMALLGEGMAQQILQQDNQVNTTDSLQDNWAKPISAPAFAGGQLQVQITDATSRFNLNNLYHDGKPDPLAVAYLQALLLHVGLEPSIANAALDWQDPDNQPTPDGGAEAEYYQTLGSARVAPISNQPFHTVDELRFVRGMDGQKLAVIAPYLTAQPFYTPINVNTAEPVLIQIAPIAAALSKTSSQQQQANTQAAANRPSTADIDPATLALDAQAVNAWANTRRDTPALESVSQFWALPMFGQNQDLSRLAALFDVQSRAFDVTVTAEQDGKQRILQSTLAKVDEPSNNLNPNFASNAPSLAPTPKVMVAFNRRFVPSVASTHANQTN